MRILIVYLIFASVLTTAADDHQGLQASIKPNIVFIMADDLAWADTGFNNTKFYETPNIDKLCKSGMKYNRAYSGGPNCLPTRACLISGMYTPRTKIWTPGGKAKGQKTWMKLDVTTNNKDGLVSKTNLEPSVTSIAEVLKSAGYTTARFGKWHVGPDTQGFDISDPNGKGGKIGKNTTVTSMSMNGSPTPAANSSRPTRTNLSSCTSATGTSTPPSGRARMSPPSIRRNSTPKNGTASGAPSTPP
jgi:arylsulfatase A-like enzyme